MNAELKNEYPFGKSSFVQKNNEEIQQQSNEDALVEFKNGPHVKDVKFDDSGIVDIQFICTSLKDGVVVQGGEEYVEIKSKEELNSVMNTLGKEDRIKVLIGRENTDGDWEYEEVETTIERTIVDPEYSIYKKVIKVCY